MSPLAAATSGLMHALAAFALITQLPPHRVPASERALEFTVDLVSPPPSPITAAQQAPLEMPQAAEAPLPPALPLPDLKPLAELIPPASDPQPSAPADFLPPPPGQTLEKAVPSPDESPVVAARELARDVPAPPPLTLPKAPPPRARPVTPAPTTTVAAKPAVEEGERRVREDYLVQVIQKISRYRYYPKSAEASEHGVVVTRVTVARDGQLLDVALTKSSGFPNLDRGLLETIRQAAPFAPLPPDIAASQLSFILPISYAHER
jgi:protein TonB